MIKATTRLGMTLGAALLLGAVFSVPEVRAAMESASFQMVDPSLEDAEYAPHQSPSYQLQGGTTWAQQPIAGNNFRIEPDTAQASSAVSTASSAVSTQGGEGGGDGGQGSHRGDTAPGHGGSQQRSSVSAGASSRPASANGAQRSSAASQGMHPAAGTSSAGVLPPVGSVITPSSVQGASAGAQASMGSFTSVSSAGDTSSCGSSVLHPSDDTPHTLPLTWTSGFLLGVLCGMSLLLPYLPRKKKKAAMTTVLHWMRRILFMVALAIVCMVMIAETAHAETTAPQSHVYNGRLLDGAGNAITTAHSIRFSYWKSTDFTATDITAGGAIDTAAATYAGWQEVHTVTPDSRGFFSVQLGSVTTFPSVASFTPAELQSLFLQVEVKASAAADTAYELLDSDSSSATVDRSPVLSVPFALNADKLDRHDVGTGSGDIAVLQSGGLLPLSTVPGGTNRDAFVLDADDSASAAIDLQFGTTIAEKLTYDLANDRFTFTDDLRVEGDLTVTGLINGVDITALSGSGGGLPRDMQMTFSPSFNDVSFSADGSDNVGQLTVAFDDVAKRNFYQWSSTRGTLQDYTVVLRVPVPGDFHSWRGNPLVVYYRSGSNDIAVNKADITVSDTQNTAVTLSGSSLDLASTSWASTELEFTGSPVWEAGGSFLIKFHLSAKDLSTMQLGDILLKYVRFP